MSIVHPCTPSDLRKQRNLDLTDHSPVTHTELLLRETNRNNVRMVQISLERTPK
jgi:hypothetical protein